MKFFHQDTVTVWGFCWKKTKACLLYYESIFHTTGRPLCMLTPCAQCVCSACNRWQHVSVLTFWLKLAERRNKPNWRSAAKCGRKYGSQHTKVYRYTKNCKDEKNIKNSTHKRDLLTGQLTLIMSLEDISWSEMLPVTVQWMGFAIKNKTGPTWRPFNMTCSSFYMSQASKREFTDEVRDKLLC